MDLKKCPTPWKLLLEEVKEEIHPFPRKKKFPQQLETLSLVEDMKSCFQMQINK